MTIAEEIKLLTTDPGARRLAEIADQIQEQVNRCCGYGSDLRPEAPSPSLAPPAPATEPNKP
jgi:ABC-type Zn2+ transport system substrate-binding protein/surface adhesin